MKKTLTPQQKRLEEQKKLFKNKIVIQKNDFLKGDTSPFSINELKIFKLIISKVKSQETLFENIYEISTEEVKALNINETHLHKETTNSLKKLANIYIEIPTDDGGYREVGLIRNDFKFPKYSKKIIITFNDDMKQYLLDIKGNFTKYSLIDIVNYKLKHTLKLYEFIKSVNLNIMKVKISTLKKELDLIGKYDKFFELKRKVLEPCITEINEKTESLNITYSTEKEGREITVIIFHIQRFDTKDLVNEEEEITHNYKHLIGEECIYLNKYHKLDSIDIDENIIALKEIGSDNFNNIMSSTKEQLENNLKALFKEKYNNIIIDIKIEKDELQELYKYKDFKKFKQKVIDTYTNKELINNVAGFHEDTIISINELGLLINSKTNKIITSTESFAIWKHLFKNKDQVGVISKNITPIKKFIGVKIDLDKRVELTGLIETFTYIIEDVKEEENNMFRLYLKDVFDEQIELSKSLLTYEQLENIIKIKLHKEKEH